jgi:peroxiredoxin
MGKINRHTFAPDFKLNDVQGEPVTLSQFRDQNNILLVLNRGFN